MVSINRYQLAASVCKDSFFEFVKRFWPVIIQEEPVWNWHIEFLCSELQRAAELVFANKPREKDYIVNVPPGTTKSTICSIMYPAWILSRMPHARIICASHTDQLVLDLSTKSRMIVESEQYQRWFPYITLKKDQNTKGYWATSQGGMRMTATIGGKNPMGFHAHFIIVDDPIDPQKVFSAAELKVANDFMDMTVPTRRVQQDLTVTIIIMQRLHQDDPTGHRLANPALGPVRHICLPAEESSNVKPAYLKKRYVDGLLDPVRLSEKTLREKKAMGRFAYAGQYEQHPVPLGGGQFDTTKLNFGKVPPDEDFVRIFRYWDKAGTKDAGARTAGVKIGIQKHTRRIWIMNVVKGQWNPFDRENIIKQTAILDGRGVKIGVEVEPGSGGKESAESTARNLLGYTVILDRPTGDKFIRAEPIAAQVGAGNVYLPDNAEWVREYIDEMMYFGPQGKYKDQIDATSGGFHLLTAVVKIGAF